MVELLRPPPLAREGHPTRGALSLPWGAMDDDGEDDRSFGAPDDDDDDIARFERECAARARAEGLMSPREEEMDAEAIQSDEEDEEIQKARLLANTGRAPQAEGDWQRKCGLLQDKLSRREAELQQAKQDIELLKSNDQGSGAFAELKQRLLELTKKGRRQQVTLETQRVRIQQLEGEMKKPREELRAKAEEMAAQQSAALLGDNAEDWKKKYLASSNKLQEVRQEIQELRATAAKQKKVLLKELGSEETVDKALAVADDPNAGGWKGRAAQVSQLQRQVKELKEQLRKAAAAPRPDGEHEELAEAAQPPRRRAPERAEKDRDAVGQVAEKRREEFEKLQEEVEKLRGEAADAKRKRDALKSRAGVLEGQLRETKVHIQTLLSKSENDDELVEGLRKQLGRHGGPPQSGPGVPGAGLAEVERLREENAEQQAQLDRQAQIVLQLRQKSLAKSCENGSLRLGPDAAVNEQGLLDRVRYLEAENAKLEERGRLMEDGNNGRPFSAGSTFNLQEQLRLMTEKLKGADRENRRLREQLEEGRPGSADSTASHGGGAGPGSEQLLKQNEALKREIVRLRQSGAN